MATYKPAKYNKPAKIHNLVEACLSAHKRDIHDYAGGHLNSSKYVLPASFTETVDRPTKWLSSKPRNVSKPGSKRAKRKQNKMNLMSNALMDFSFGSSGIIPAHPSKKASSVSLTDNAQNDPMAPSETEKLLEKRLMSEMESLMLVKDVTFPYVEGEHYSPFHQEAKEDMSSSLKKKTFSVAKKSFSSNTCIEELKLPEVMLTTFDSNLAIPPSMQIPNEAARFAPERKKFVTTHLAGITCKDQFRKMLDFEESVLHKRETLEKGLSDGHKAVEHLENKLVTRLMELQNQDGALGPSFERLQLYSEIWSDLIQDSSILGTLLSEIKDEYDNYLTTLLDSMKSTDRSELSQCLKAVEYLANEEKSKYSESLHTNVEEFETLCRSSLLKNHDLQHEIQEIKSMVEEEKRMQKEEEEENSKRLMSFGKFQRRKSEGQKNGLSLSTRFSRDTPGQKVKALRIEIWEKIDTLLQQRRLLKTAFIPKMLHRNLQHAIKDTELEIQKLQQQNAFLSHQRKDYSEQLNAVFATHRVHQDDAKKIWEILEDDTTVGNDIEDIILTSLDD